MHSSRCGGEAGSSSTGGLCRQGCQQQPLGAPGQLRAAQGMPSSNII